MTSASPVFRCVLLVVLSNQQGAPSVDSSLTVNVPQSTIIRQRKDALIDRNRFIIKPTLDHRPSVSLSTCLSVRLQGCICGFTMVTGGAARLVFGYDSYGNTCGRRNEQIEGVRLSGLDHTDRK